MSFETDTRIIAVAPELIVPLFTALQGQFGEDLPDGARTIKTIGAFWDDIEQTRLRAASLTDGTITGAPLIDGRLAYRCLWQTDLATQFDGGGLEGVEELTEEEFRELLPPLES